MATVIVDYDAGNLRSVQRACHYVGLDTRISGAPAEVRRAERIIFPGLGQAASAMATLRRQGLDEALHAAFAAGVPVLGICLGLQIVLTCSEEGNTPMLGLISGQVRRFCLDDPGLKIPHMGWNQIRVLHPHPVLSGISGEDEFYFVHSCYAEPECREHVLAQSCYERTFCSVLGCRNYIGVQFHVEKSGRAGLSLLGAFAAWDGMSATPAKGQAPEQGQ